MKYTMIVKIVIKKGCVFKSDQCH